MIDYHWPTSTPRRCLTKCETSAISKFRATRPLLPRFPNSISGLTTSFVDESHGWASTSWVKSVASVTYPQIGLYRLRNRTKKMRRRIEWSGDGGSDTWADKIWRSMPASLLRCSLRRRLESYSLIFFLAIADCCRQSNWDLEGGGDLFVFSNTTEMCERNRWNSDRGCWGLGSMFQSWLLKL